jgi:hypothetical protein
MVKAGRGRTGLAAGRRNATRTLILGQLSCPDPSFAVSQIRPVRPFCNRTGITVFSSAIALAAIASG